MRLLIGLLLVIKKLLLRVSGSERSLFRSIPICCSSVEMLLIIGITAKTHAKKPENSFAKQIFRNFLIRNKPY